MKKIALAILLLVLAVSLCACNYQMLDTKFHFDRAQIVMPDGSLVSGKVQSWTDYEGEQLQIKIDGVTYLVHSENVVMISE